MKVGIEVRQLDMQAAYRMNVIHASLHKEMDKGTERARCVEREYIGRVRHKMRFRIDLATSMK